MDKPDKEFKHKIAEDEGVHLIVEDGVEDRIDDGADQRASSATANGAQPSNDSVQQDAIPGKSAPDRALAPGRSRSAKAARSSPSASASPAARSGKKSATSMPRRILNLALFGIGAVVFSIAAISANYWVYMQGAINAPDMKALKTAMQLAHENRMTDAEHTLEPFVFDTKNSSHECAKALAAMYAFDNKFDRMEEAVLVISCGKKEKVPNHMRNLGLAMVEQRPEIAAKVLERTAILQKESFGEDGEYGKDLYWTALSESTIGQRDQAIKHLQIAVPILEKHYGTASSKTPAAKELLNKLTTTSTKEH